MRHSVFYSAVFGFLVGIFVSSNIAFSYEALFFATLISVALFVYVFQAQLVFVDAEIKQYTYFFLVIVFLLCACFGCVRYAFYGSWKGDSVLKSMIDTKIIAEGTVVDEPSIKEKSATVTVELKTLLNNQKRIIITPTKILLTTDPYSYPHYGDLIKIMGKIELPQNIVNQNGRTFDYVSYLAKDKIFFVMKFAQVLILSHDNANPIKSLTLKIKESFLRALDQALPFPESRLAAGLVVAGKQALPKSIQDEFTKTGTIQVVVLSGYNVTLVAETMSELLSFLPTLFGVSVGAISIILFSIAAGGSATVMRAVIMVMIVLLGKSFKRKYNVGRALIISALLMLAFNPMLLVFDPSFQLSFLATIGLMYVSPLLEKYSLWVPERLTLRQVFVATCATQIFVTPFILYLTSTTSLVAIPANLALFLLTPLTMFFSFVTGACALLSVFLAQPISFVAFLFLTTMLRIVHIFSGLSFASLTIPAFPLWLVAVIYICYSVILYRFYFVKQQKSPESGA
jgi:competence protein ComEC